jgi:vacuolar-type H+-ATPase subunit I/STV1
MKWINNFANHSLLGNIISHPLWFGILIVISVIVVIYVIGWEDELSVKLVFYLGAVILCLITVHDSLLRAKWEEIHETDTGSNFIRDVIDTNPDGIKISPRPVEEAQRGLNNFTSQNTEPIESADDALKFVQQL